MTGGVLVLLFACLFPFAGGSLGDRFSFFQDCAAFCRRDYLCPELNSAYEWTTRPCFQCRQRCISETLKIFQENGWPMPQFFGKWPFRPIDIDFGGFPVIVQEPASVLFSLLNMLAVFHMRKRVVLEISTDYRLRGIWRCYSWIGVIVWICSALFHARDFWITEYLDYFAACGVVFYAFFVSISFTVPWLQESSTGVATWLLLAFATFSFYVGHVASLLKDFNYGHNMYYCIVLSVATALVYSLWVARELVHGRRRRSLALIAGIILVGMGSALFELLDFPPILGVLDAHSIFHLATIPTPLLIAEFAVREAEYELFSFARKGKLV